METKNRLLVREQSGYEIKGENPRAPEKTNHEGSGRARLQSCRKNYPDATRLQPLRCARTSIFLS